MRVQAYELEHIKTVRKLSPECMVLLKSDGSFPVTQGGKLALYGSGGRQTVKGGTGSGNVNVRAFTTIEQGLTEAGFQLTTASWLDCYDKIRQQAEESYMNYLKEKIAAGGVTAFLESMGDQMPEPEYSLPLEGEGDTAIYVLARISGEGTDRKAVKGDIYMTNTEIRDILSLSEKYKKFMLILNTGGIIDLSPVVNQVPNILLCSQLGISMGNALADVLVGKSAPSGKLAATWTSMEDYRYIKDFGHPDDTRYEEGIYVGYRYFDTVGRKVLFPFGFGLSYTKFDIACGNPVIEKSKVTVPVQVKNTGDYHGKEVIQMYVSVPSGKLDQPYQMLAAFQKTKLLSPGQVQLLQLAFDMRELASFDEEESARVLESGAYLLRVGNSSRSTKCVGTVLLKDTIEIEKLQHIGGKIDFIDRGKKQTRANKEICTEQPVLVVEKRDFDVTKHVNTEIDSDALKIAAQMTDEDLIYMCIGRFDEREHQGVIGNTDLTVAGEAGESCGKFNDKGIPKLVMADGPAGLRLSRKYGVDDNGVYSLDMGSQTTVLKLLPDDLAKKLFGTPSKREGEIYEQNCTAIPIGSAIAQSWNRDVAEKCGDLIGDEMQRFGIHLWLAPALNIQRHPLCGRNFEYYSEDPMLSGHMAAAVTHGVQNHPGCGVTIKHFVCNNQETNRFRSNSMVSERALRDIYMKGFEIVVREAEPHALMSSYNLLNGEHTSEREDLMEEVLRNEWGFRGLVMSDWVTGTIPGHFKYRVALASKSIAAGNDLMMPGAKSHYDDIMNALKNKDGNGTLTRAQLEKCAARVIAVARKLGRKERE